MGMALLASTLLVSSAFNETTFSTEPGAIAPLISASNDSGNVALEQMRGDYVLLSFGRRTTPNHVSTATTMPNGLSDTAAAFAILRLTLTKTQLFSKR